MPRRGLDTARVIAHAAAVADAEGLEAVSVARVASDLGVRAPSLYNHVAGRDGLLRGIALRGAGELTAALSEAAVGRAGADAIRATAAAYRAYALAHPGAYAATVRAPPPDDPELQAAAEAFLGLVAGLLRGYDVEGDALVHRTRSLRAALHGFVLLEQQGGFALPVDVDASFAWHVERLISALSDA